MKTRHQKRKLALLIAALCLGCEKSPPQATAAQHASPLPSAAFHVVNPNLYASLVSNDGTTLLTAGTDGIIKYSRDGQLWHNANTSNTQHAIFDLQQNSHTGTLIAVGDFGTILRSTDKGKHWAKQTSDTTRPITRLTYSRFAKTWLAVGAEGTALKSVDDGISWQKMDGLTFQALQKVQSIDATKTWLIAAEQNLWLSTDQGLHWHTAPIANNLSVTCITSFSSKNITLATTSNGELLLQTHNGWLKKPISQGKYISALAHNNSTLVAASSDGWVFTSENLGDTWLGRKLNDNYIATIVWHPTANKFVLAGSGATLFVSDANGLDWQNIPTALTDDFETLIPLENNNTVTALGIGSQTATISLKDNSVRHTQQSLSGFVHSINWLPSGRVITSGAEGWLKKSDSFGKNWEQVLASTSNSDYLFSIKYLPQSKTLLAGGPPGVVFRSEDNGDTWEKVLEAEEASDGHFHTLITDPKREIGVALASPGRLRYSLDTGKTWQFTNADTSSHLYNGEANPETGTILAIGQNSIVQRSQDGGLWQKTELLGDESLQAITFNPYTNTWFIGGEGGALWRSMDDAKTWQRLDSKTLRYIYNLAALKNNILLATGNKGLILRSDDNGESWHNIPSGVEENLRAPLEANNTIYISGRNGSIITSNDGGKSWQIEASHTAESLRVMAASPDGNHIIAAGRRIVVMDKN